MCLTVQVVWQVKHCGCGSCFKMKEWVSLVWPICNRDITTCSLLDFLDAGLHSPEVGWIWKSLLWMLLLHYCCHFVWRNLLIVGFRSEYGILDLSGVRSKANLAAKSALSFPLAPMWLGVQHIIISFLFDTESNLLNSLMIRGIWNFLFLNDSKTESECENIFNFLVPYIHIQILWVVLSVTVIIVGNWIDPGSNAWWGFLPFISCQCP